MKREMNIIYRKLTDDDLETFISMRSAQLREEGATDEMDLSPALMEINPFHPLHPLHATD